MKSALAIPLTCLLVVSSVTCVAREQSNAEPPDGATASSGVGREPPDSLERSAPAPAPGQVGDPRTGGRAPLGVWRIIEEQVDGRRSSLPGQRLRLVSERRFVQLHVDAGRVLDAIQGACRLRSGEYSERIESVLHERDAWMLNQWIHYTSRMDRDRWILEGTMERPAGSLRVRQVLERDE